MAAAHQHSGGNKRSRFLSRLFPWRQSSARQQQQQQYQPPPSSSSSSVASSRMAVPGGGILKETPTSGRSLGGGHHRRTSPVDLHLGELPPSPPLRLPSSSSPVSQYAVPRPPPSPYEMVSSSHHSSGQQRFAAISFPTAEPSPSLPPPPLAPASTPRIPRIPPLPMPVPQHEIEHEELNALRHLASELHSALRLSEQENVLLKAKLQTMDDWGLMDDQQQQQHNHSLLGNVNNNGGCSQTAKLDQLIEDLREIGSSQPSSPYSSPYIQRRNMRELGRILQQRQTELRRLTAELHQTQTELLFSQVELDGVRRCLRRLDQRLLFAEEELDLARQGLLQASISKQRLMQELQTTRGLLMRCWARVRVLEQQHEGLGQLPIVSQGT